MENSRELEEAARGRRSAADGDGEQLNGIRWEQFLKRRSLRVLLVEQDDSTRHIVAALLRKCSYHVAAAADGMKAWEVMKEKNCSFDLVLTEVEMPSLSGIDLLTKIVGAEECKNIPVIMMSVQDSVGVVLKCMLKGAADFLVKPVRKNELRNLWQHVWRRHCSSSYATALDNHAASNHICSMAAVRSQTGENSDDHSDAQSLGSKTDGNIEIHQNEAASVLAKEGFLVGGAEVHPEKTVNNVTTLAVSSSVSDNGGLRDKTLLAGDAAVLPIQIPHGVENSRHTPYGVENLGSKGDIEKPSLYSQINTPEEPAENMVGFVESLKDVQSSYAVIRTDIIEENGLPEAVGSSQTKHASDLSTPPLREVALKGSQLNGLIKHQFKADCILNHSNASAFSRYVCKNANSSLKSNSSYICIGTTEYVDQLQSQVGADSGKNSLFSHIGEGLEHLNMFSDGSMKDVGSGAQTQDGYVGPSSSRDLNAFRHAQLGFLPMPIPVGAIPYQSSCAEYGTVLRPIFYRDNCLIPPSPAAGENETFQIHSDHSARNEDHVTANSRSVEFCYHDLNDPQPNRGRGNEAEAGELRDWSTNHGDKFFQSVNYGQDTLKGTGDYIRESTEAAAATGTALESCNESGVINCGKNGTNSDCSRREAALIKFRLKRKDRCFEKKVRYHSRQKLAEQRPRVKGQFVRQKLLENNTQQRVGMANSGISACIL